MITQQSPRRYERMTPPVSQARWPDDFASIDGGRLWIRRDLLDVFAQKGWTTFDALMSTDQCEVVRRVGQRDNCRLDLPLPSGRTRAYLKRHQGRSFYERLANRFLGRFCVPAGMAEAEAVGRCQRARVGTMRVVVAGRDHAGCAHGRRSLFMSEEIPGGVPADDFWMQRFGKGQVEDDDRDNRKRLLHAMASTARRFHDAGLFHRDFYWCHFFVREPEPGIFEVRLIDLQRVRRSRYMRWRWLLKDLAQFVVSTPPGAVSATELRDWFRMYCCSAGRHSWLEEAGYLAVWIRAAFYRWKDAPS